MTITKLEETKGRKLTIEDVYDLFDKYNFIIFTKMGSIDTSVYNVAKLNKSETILGQASKKSLELWRVTPDAKAFNGTDITVPANNQTYELERYIKIHENIKKEDATKKIKKTSEISDIKVKSVRNFIKNQLEAKKL